MIVRVLGEGQWRIESTGTVELNVLDDAIESAVRAGDQDELASALRQLHDKVRALGTEVPDDELADSDLILPATDATLEDVRDLLSESGEGLIPN